MPLGGAPMCGGFSRYARVLRARHPALGSAMACCAHASMVREGVPDLDAGWQRQCYAIVEASAAASRPRPGMKVVIPGGTGQVGGVLRRALAARMTISFRALRTPCKPAGDFLRIAVLS